MGSHWPQRVTIVGLGLIGGSIGLAIRDHRPGVRVVGVDRDERTLARAAQREAVHEAHRSLHDGIAGADLVVLAGPISSILEQLEELPGRLDEGSLVTDVGSTKRTICQRGHARLGGRFVGGHPMAGSEQSGIEAAQADLFRDTVWVLTPDGRALASLVALLEELGAQVMTTTPEQHDRVVATTSHLPQLLSVALGKRLADESDEDSSYRSLISSGGTDWLRLARSSPSLWRDVVATNDDVIRDEIRALIRDLHELGDDVDRLERSFERANRLAREIEGPYRGTVTMEVNSRGHQQGRPH